MPLSKTLLAQLRAYWRSYRPTDWLFPGRTFAEALSMTSVQKAFTQAKARAGVEKIGDIHGLRHAYGTAIRPCPTTTPAATARAANAEPHKPGVSGNRRPCYRPRE